MSDRSRGPIAAPRLCFVQRGRNQVRARVLATTSLAAALIIFFFFVLRANCVRKVGRSARLLRTHPSEAPPPPSEPRKREAGRRPMIGALRRRGGAEHPRPRPHQQRSLLGRKGSPTSPPYRTPPVWGPPVSVGRWFPRGDCLKGRGHAGPSALPQAQRQRDTGFGFETSHTSLSTLLWLASNSHSPASGLLELRRAPARPPNGVLGPASLRRSPAASVPCLRELAPQLGTAVGCRNDRALIRRLPLSSPSLSQHPEPEQWPIEGPPPHWKVQAWLWLTCLPCFPGSPTVVAVQKTNKLLSG